MNKKAVEISPIYFIIAGAILFLVVTCTIGNGVTKAFTQSKQEKGFEELTKAMREVAESQTNIVKIATLEIKEESAIYMFSDEVALKEGQFKGEDYENRWFVIRPEECKGKELCVCLCEDVSLKEPNDIKKNNLIKYYENSNDESVEKDDKIYELNCKNKPQCQILPNVKLASPIVINKIVSEEKINTIEQKEMENTGTWENGFSFKRPEYYSPSGGMISIREEILNGNIGLVSIYVAKKNGEIKLYFYDCLEGNNCN